MTAEPDQPVHFTGADAERFLSELPDELPAEATMQLRASVAAAEAAMIASGRCETMPRVHLFADYEINFICPECKVGLAIYPNGDRRCLTDFPQKCSAYGQMFVCVPLQDRVTKLEARLTAADID